MINNKTDIIGYMQLFCELPASKEAGFRRN